MSATASLTGDGKPCVLDSFYTLGGRECICFSLSFLIPTFWMVRVWSLLNMLNVFKKSFGSNFIKVKIPVYPCRYMRLRSRTFTYSNSRPDSIAPRCNFGLSDPRPAKQGRASVQPTSPHSGIENPGPRLCLLPPWFALQPSLPPRGLPLPAGSRLLALAAPGRRKRVPLALAPREALCLAPTPAG